MLTYIDEATPPGGAELHGALVTPSLRAELGHGDLLHGAGLPGEGGALGGRGVAAHHVTADLLLHSLAADNIILDLRKNLSKVCKKNSQNIRSNSSEKPVKIQLNFGGKPVKNLSNLSKRKPRKRFYKS